MAGSEPPVVVLGGGFAGLACATALAEKGVPVTVVEKKPHLGGRAHSFTHPRVGEIDNGQHLLMGCYRQTRAFLSRIGTEGLLRLPSGVRVDYASPDGSRDSLRCPGLLPAPLHLAVGVARLRGLSLRDKAGLVGLRSYFMPRLHGPLPVELDRVTVREWLGTLGQTPAAQERLFDPIAIGALNELPERASALGFAQVLREIFFRDAESSRLGFPITGLSELYATPAHRFLATFTGTSILLNRKVVGITHRDGRASGVVLEDGFCLPARAVVSALPHLALAKLERPAVLRGPWESLPTAPIIGIHLRLDRPVVDRPLTGLLGTDLHWVFDKSALWNLNGGGQNLSLVISGAHAHLGKSPAELLELAKRDMGACFPAWKKANIEGWCVIKEPFATLSPVPGSDAARPAHRSPLPGFFYAGDWTQTGLPATIESATASGHACARLILEDA